MAAVHRAYKAATEFGLPEGFASALANTAVDPAALRTALNNPTRINVAGGVIEVIDVDLYTPGLVPLPTNNRTMDMRIYPAGGATGYLGPLTGPRSQPGMTSELFIEAQSVQHALDEARHAQEYVLVKNPLKDSVAARGIVMPVTVVYFELRHRDGQPAMPLLGTADGSSRITGAHAVLNLVDPRTTHYDLPADRDSYRRFVDSISSPDITSLGVTAARRLRWQRNALITPARIFLRFTPQLGAAYDFGRAVAAYVGMLHVDPPRPWTPTGKLEAMAEAVLEVLRSANVLDDVRHDYLAGLLTPEASEAAGLPTQPDEQAAHVLATLLKRDLRELVDRGIMDVTAKKSVSASRRTDVVAELALRPTRSAAVTLPQGDPARERATAMRATYLRTTHLPAYTARRWEVTGRSPDDLLDGALAELEHPRGRAGKSGRVAPPARARRARAIPPDRVRGTEARPDGQQGRRRARPARNPRSDAAGRAWAQVAAAGGRRRPRRCSSTPGRRGGPGRSRRSRRGWRCPTRSGRAGRAVDRPVVTVRRLPERWPDDSPGVDSIRVAHDEGIPAPAARPAHRRADGEEHGRARQP